jgi:tripartite-type tricarboxylate transporter receptor subunit TctC
MKAMTPWRLSLTATLAAVAGMSLPAHASSYPEKTITVVVPYSPAGGVDIITRLVTPPMAQTLKQSMVVDNKPGGGTNIGMSIVARSAADGYTLLTSSNTLTTNKALYTKLNYDPVADLVPVARIGEAPLVVVVNAKSPFQTLADLMNAGKAKPDSLSFGTAGVGSSGHMASELLIRAGGVKAVHVPYKGGSAAVTDLLGGRLDFMAINPLEVVPHVQGGTLRALAMLNQKGSHLLPEVKTAKALGYDVEATVWWGLNVPKGTPEAVIATLNKALNSALATPEVQKKLSDIGASPVGGSAEDFRKFIAKESASLSELIKAANIQAD